MLGWSAAELAAVSKVGQATIRRYELQDGIPIASTKILMQLKEAFEHEGIEFTGDPLKNPGVILHLK